ncbi:MAG: choice-of-anchor tandem repeat GloVer-containing protein [Candidatus Cybelea sp.]
MKILGFSRCALLSCIALAMLAGCGGSQPPIGGPGVIPQSHPLIARGGSSSYRVLYRFGDKPDGATPDGSLIDVHGTLYGTTEAGGADVEGGVFSITTGGAEKMLYDFKKRPDGERPIAGLIDVKGTLYGTTYFGGGEPRGTVFSVTTGGVEQVLYAFLDKGAHGGHPAASLTDENGKLYGTTEDGGAHGVGTVFSITTSGVEKELYSFGPSGDGASPVASLIDVGGTLYGTTAAGGTYKEGTVFSITTNGAERVVYSFAGGGDGGDPRAGLVDVGGTLYGTTYSGGTANRGTVFSITTSGSEKVVYSFAGSGEGSNPAAGLIDVDGTLYGTTISGGGSRACRFPFNGCGTVFRISPSGAETVIYSFAGGSDGAAPGAAPLDIAGVLYGTTMFGGSYDKKCHHARGCGTVFKLTL